MTTVALASFEVGALWLYLFSKIGHIGIASRGLHPRIPPGVSVVETAR
jgi:hypothetical protein